MIQYNVMQGKGKVPTVNPQTIRRQDVVLIFSMVLSWSLIVGLMHQYYKLIVISCYKL